MKFLKRIGIIMIVVAIGLILPGLLFPSFEYETQFTYDAAPDSLFFSLTQPSTFKHWRYGILDVNLSSPFSFSTKKYDLLIGDANGRRLYFQEKILHIQPSEQIKYETESPSFIKKTEYQLHSKNGQTRLKARYHFKGKNVIWRSLFWYIKNHFQTEDQQNLEQLNSFLQIDELKK